MSQINDSLNVNGSVSGTTWNGPNNSVPARCVVSRFPATFVVPHGADVVDLTAPFFTFLLPGAIVAITVTPQLAPNGGDKKYTVDIRKGNAGGAFASILSSVVEIDDAETDRQVVSAVLASTPTSAAALDSLQLVTDASGSTGSQGQGYVVTVWIEANAV